MEITPWELYYGKKKLEKKKNLIETVNSFISCMYLYNQFIIRAEEMIRGGHGISLSKPRRRQRRWHLKIKKF